MTGELLQVWPRTWNEIWLRLAKSKTAPADLFVVLVTDLAIVPKQPIPPPAPPADAFNAVGEIVDAEAIEARDDYTPTCGRFNGFAVYREHISPKELYTKLALL
jgi:hypothetical protein